MIFQDFGKNLEKIILIVVWVFSRSILETLKYDLETVLKKILKCQQDVDFFQDWAVGVGRKGS